MLNTRTYSQSKHKNNQVFQKEKEIGKGKQKERDGDQGLSYKITGWVNEQCSDYSSYGISSYLKPNFSKDLSQLKPNKSSIKRRKISYNDENKSSFGSKDKHLPSKNMSMRGEPQSSKDRLGCKFTENNISTQLKLEQREPRRESGNRANNFTHRMMGRKEYPRGIYQFKQTRRQLTQLNKLSNGLSSRLSNVLVQDNKAMNVLPRIKPYLNCNKVLKLQNLNQRRLSPLNISPRLSKHKNRDIEGRCLPQFDDQKIYSLSVHCIDN